MSFSALLIVIGMVMLPTLGEEALSPVAAIMGFANGGVYALMAVVIEEIFGPQDLPLKYSCVMAAGCFGSLIFSDLLAGRTYDAAAARQGQQVCLGGECFGLAFWVTAVCACLACLSIAVVSTRSRSIYVQVNVALGHAAESAISLQPAS